MTRIMIYNGYFRKFLNCSNFIKGVIRHQLSALGVWSSESFASAEFPGRKELSPLWSVQPFGRSFSQTFQHAREFSSNRYYDSSWFCKHKNRFYTTFNLEDPNSADKHETSEIILRELQMYGQTGDIEVSKLVDCATKLKNVAYAELFHIPWLHTDNSAIAYMQLLMNNKIEEFFGSIHEHEGFKSFCKSLDKNFAQIPEDRCPDILLSLIYLGTDHTDPLVHKLINRLLDSCSTMSIHNLCKTAEILRSFRKGHIHMIQLMIKRLEELLDKGLEGENGSLIQDFCVLHIYLNNYLSAEFSNKCSASILSLLTKSPGLGNPLQVGTCLRYARKLYFSSGKNDKTRFIQVAEFACSQIPQFLDRLETQHIAEYCHNLKKMGLYTGKIAEQLRNKSLEMLEQENLQVREVTNLMYAFTRNEPVEMKRKLVDMMLKYIDDVDVLILSNLGDIFIDINLDDPILINHFQLKTLDLFDNLSQYITRFFKVLRLLTRRYSQNEAFRLQFFEELMKLLEGQHGISVWSICVIAQYILPNVRHTIPHSLMDRLLAAIPQCDLVLIGHILNGLNHMQRPWIRRLHSQVLELRMTVQKNILEKIENVETIEMMLQMLTGLYIRSTRKDQALLDKMLKHLPSLTKTLTSSQFHRLTRTLKRLSCYYPEVYEDLVAFMLENPNEMDFSKISDLVELLSRTGYTPNRIDQFSEFCGDILESALDQDDLVGQVSFAFDLCRLQIFPEKCLSKMFTFEYLEEVDSLLEARPEMKSYTEDLMMKLNRCVVLECPHLDIPWFHEEYCQEKMKEPYPNAKIFTFELEVENTLAELLGGPRFFKAGVQSPYHHYINFECLLDSDGKPVTYATSSIVDPHQMGYQRIAVLVMLESHYCTNSRNLKGYHISKCRHLEIMDYKVVEVMFYEWHSMALADHSARLNYLREKIFS